MADRTTGLIAALAVAGFLVVTVEAHSAPAMSLSSNAYNTIQREISTAVALGQDAPVSAETQYQSLMTEFSATARALWESTTDEEKNAVAERMVKLSPRFLQLAENNPGDSTALKSLVQVVSQEIWLENNTLYPGRAGESLEDKAIALLLQNHIGSTELGEACTRMSYGFRKQCETFLRTVMATNHHREVQGLACLRLAQFLNSRWRRLDLISGQPEMAKRYVGLFGKDYLEELRRMERAEALEEIESIFALAAEKFGDIGLPYGGTVAATAASEINEIRHLSIGMTAPEIEGEDQDGGPFKLTHYRGTVVLLYFWSEF